MATLIGKTVGKYRVVARLGRGGMAEVYKAYQPGLQRYVGIKVLHAHLVDDSDFIGRFEREALAIGKLRHPNIVQALDFDREGETYFMAMEFIDGPTLKDELKARKAANQPFTFQEISLIFTGLCSAIDYAHARGMVHRDIKPANVMINDEGQIVLTDFGIARIMGTTQYTATGALSGTPAYMSPEQGQGERGDERSDIYSLGVMFYEMVTGMVPYDADTPFAVIMKHISQPLPLPTKVNPDIPESVEEVILKAMSKEPDDRYQTASDMAIALRDAVSVSPDDNLRKNPLVIVAPKLKIDQIEHPTGPITAMERTVSASDPGDEATVWSSGGTATAVAAPPKKQSMLPIFIGGGAVILILIGIIAFLAWSSSATPATPTRDVGATETFVAIAAVTDEAQKQVAAAAAADATATAEAEEAIAATAAILAPIKTAEAATAEVERAKATADAKATQDANLIGGFLATSQAATAEAATAQAAVAETAAAEAAMTATSEAAEAEVSAAGTAEVATAEAANLAMAGAATAEAATAAAALFTPTFTPTPTSAPTPDRPPISGKIAFPVENGRGNYDVIIASIPDGKTLGKIEGSRQPHFRNDGTKLLVNGQGGTFGENIFEASSSGSINRVVSGSPSDQFPIFKPDGSTIAYSNPQLAFGSQGYQSYLFVQCSVNPPVQEEDPKCAAIADFMIIIPAGAIGDVIGSHPVWTTGDRLVYKGCNTWRGGGSCGLFSVGSWATKRYTEGETPQKILDGTSLHPTDAKAGLIAYMSNGTGDWEAYIAGENGENPTNVSRSPTSNDGVPTISPDGQWVAFASDRGGGRWAIYAAPTRGGEVQKLFDFPKGNPWIAAGGKEWFNERISWAP